MMNVRKNNSFLGTSIPRIVSISEVIYYFYFPACYYLNFEAEGA
jgi:hypothetical protein